MEKENITITVLGKLTKDEFKDIVQKMCMQGHSKSEYEVCYMDVEGDIPLAYNVQERMTHFKNSGCIRQNIIDITDRALIQKDVVDFEVSYDEKSLSSYVKLEGEKYHVETIKTFLNVKYNKI